MVSRLPSLKFLIVDDLDDNLDVFERALRREGLEIISASSGRDALEKLLVHDFALAIVDVLMPDMTGIELAELMRDNARTRHVPILFVTSGEHGRELFRGYEAGAVDYLYEPIEPVVLRNKAETFFELARQRQQLAHQLDLLREQQRVAEAASSATNEFLANVSHEIRTPMNAILGMTELVLDMPTQQGQRELLETARSAAEHLLGTIDDLLDFSKIEVGKLALEPAVFSLRVAVGDTLRALAVRAQRKGLELVSDVRSDVPDALIGDAARLRQIVVNLVGNAIKFTERGQVVVDIECAGAVEQRVRLRVVVRDTGIGISRERQAAIFRAFEQADMSSTRKYGGTGLGLTIAARLVALMAGEFTVRSEPGEGSTFAFTAVFAVQHERSHERHAPFAASAPPERELAPRRPDLVPIRILVAEDHPFNAQYLQQLLATRGHHVVLARTGREALQQVELERFDLLLLDVHMPELDGFQVIAALRERERTHGGHLPVIAVTARAREQDRERCLASGMDDFFAKPISAHALWMVIARALAPSAPEATSLLAPRVVLAACGGDEALLAKLCDMFRARLPLDLGALERALAEGDAAMLRYRAHKLGGMLATFSTEAGELAVEIEEHAAAGRCADAAPLVSRLRGMAQGLARQVEHLTIDALRRA